jgi:subtilisin family serine protease
MQPKIRSRGGVSEGFAIQLTDASAKSQVSREISELMGPDWILRGIGGRDTDYELRQSTGKISTRQAWNKAYKLRSIPGVAYAEPLFATSVSDNPAWTNDTGGKDAHLPESLDPEWSLDAIHVKEAWRQFFPDAALLPGHGVIVGHPDTGYQDHPELEGRIVSGKGYDFVYDDPDAHDDLERPLSTPVPNPGHGTGTASVIVSPVGASQRFQGNGWVTGVAPGAELIPLRTAYSVVVFSPLNLARAIEYATTEGAHVISISMGGLFSWRLRRAVMFAQSQGVIICAAAGNYAPFVTWPGVYDEVIACAASNVRGGTWRHSCKGRAVDVTAPGESVWRATVRKKGKGLSYDVSRTSGTSFATTNTAGIAAMWLSRHGRDSLIARYGRENLPIVFHRVLRDACVNFPGWKEGKFGAGLVDAFRTLDAPLPDPADYPTGGVRQRIDEHPEIDGGGVATFAHLFGANRTDSPGDDELSESDLLSGLCGLLRTSEDELPATLRATGQEIAFHFATDPDLYRSFVDVLRLDPTADVDAVRENLLSRASYQLRRQMKVPHEESNAAVNLQATPAPHL